MSAFANDAYNRTVTFSTSANIDTYTVGGSTIISFPSGTLLPAVYMSINSHVPSIDQMSLVRAQATQIANFQNSMQSYIDTIYPVEIRLNLHTIYEVAVNTGLTNRAAYILQLFTWATALIQYASVFIASIEALSTSVDVAAVDWDFNSISVQDPQVTIIGALSIND